MPDRPSASPPPSLVALASWLLPGLGYWLIGHKSRALTVGITIVALFGLGLLIGGVRVLEVPGWGDDGQPIRIDPRTGLRIDPRNDYNYERGRWVLIAEPLSEVRAKPWSIAQVLTGPVAVLGGAGSVWASRSPADSSEPRGVVSHGRVNDIGVLYTAVAGMLNLLAVIDASHRAGQTEEA